MDLPPHTTFAAALLEGLKVDDPCSVTDLALLVSLGAACGAGQGCALRGRQEEAEPPRLWRYCGGVKGGRGYMYIPLMATASHGQIGAPNAESFCERTLRGRLASGHVLKEGNTLLVRTRCSSYPPHEPQLHAVYARELQ